MWSMDFASNALLDGRQLRALTVVDAFTREALAIDDDSSIKVEVRTRITSIRGAPRIIRVANCPEFISKAVDRWAYESRVTLDFSQPAKPADNAFLKRFICRRRNECLNTHWPLSVGDVSAVIEARRRDYDDGRHQPSLGWLTRAANLHYSGQREQGADGIAG
ncbi:integrase core domain-containing protein [Sphingomonas sp. NPDC079357]|uniref:integrase core domain-containing protein n=1 Tax=Sphingomonas sp. NPDC079357 TaxID=3364518 RepID=UPI00384CDC45